MRTSILSFLLVGLILTGCSKDDAEPDQNVTNAQPSAGTNNNTAATKNTLTVDGENIPLNEYAVPTSTTPNIGYVKLDVFEGLLDSDKKGAWILGINEIPAQSTTLESSFEYHWQNLPPGKFYFNSIFDKEGKQWWYTESATIKMDVKIDGDNMTLTCKDITVGDSFLPTQVKETRTVTVSITTKISDVKNANSAGTLHKLI